jgi:ubiquinone biosynthesis protein
MNMAKGFSGVMGVKRVAGICRILVRHGFGNFFDWLGGFGAAVTKRPLDMVGKAATGFPSPERIRRIFEELGPSFIKLGQLMSTRADIFPASYIEELRKLQDQVPAVPFSEIQQVIEEELKKPVPSIFRECHAESIAAASVSQVHAARLFTGEKVAVKVIRPGIRKIIEQDIRLMYSLSGIIEKNFELGKVVGATNIVKEFERTIFNELDMFIEAGNIDRFGKNFKDSDEIHIPQVYWDLTSKSVLVMEFIDGIKMDQVETLRAAGIDPQKIALIGLRSFSRQLMEFGFFHADPHPANTIVMTANCVGIVDFGIMGFLDDDMMRHVAHLLLGFAERDYDMVMEALEDAGILRQDMANLQEFKADLKDVSEPFYGRSLKTISVRDVYDQVMQLVLKYRIKLPRNLLLLFKTLIQTEALGKILESNASLLEISRPFAKKFLEKRYDPQSLFTEMAKDIREMGSQLKTTPKWLHEILKQTAAGKQRLELHHSGFSSMDARLEKGINRLTIGIVIAASTIAASLILNSSQKVLEFSFHFMGQQTLSITGILGLAGYTIATLLGIWLIYSIFRSGKM